MVPFRFSGLFKRLIIGAPTEKPQVASMVG